MMSSYSLYLILMYFNPKLEKYVYRITNSEKEPRVPERHLGYTGLAPARDMEEDEQLCLDHHQKKRYSVNKKTSEGKENVQNVTEDKNQPRMESEGADTCRDIGDPATDRLNEHSKENLASDETKKDLEQG